MAHRKSQPPPDPMMSVGHPAATALMASTNRGASGDQQTIASQRAALDRPSTPARSARENRHADQAKARDRRSKSEDPQRAEATGIVAGALADFIGALFEADGSNEFQAVDFTSRMYELKLWPDKSVFERRGIGAMLKRLVSAGVIIQTGYAQDGGCKHTGHNSAVRPVYQIMRRTGKREVLGLS